MDGIVNKNPVNDAAVKAPRNHSKFNFSYGLAGTMRFGHYQPHFVMEGVADDHIELRSKSKIRSYTMKAPLMQDLNMNKDYFMVYNDALLPRNWDLVFTNPTVGEDVDASKVNTVIPDFNRFLESLCTKGIVSGSENLVQTGASSLTTPGVLTVAIRKALIMEMFFSSGSLTKMTGSSFNSMCRCKASSTGNNVHVFGKAGLTFDDAFDAWIFGILRFAKAIQFSSGGVNDYWLQVGDHANDADALPINVALDYLRDDAQFFIKSASFYGGASDPDTSTTATLFYAPLEFEYKGLVYDADDPDTHVPFNYARCAAYQVACAHYYTNDKIDYIYSAELYRQNLLEAYFRALRILATKNVPMFTINGMYYQYDNLSGKLVADVMDDYRISNQTWQNPNTQYWFDYFRLIFGLNRSLRYVDYFVGAKSRPLAVGDVNIDVTNNKVSAIDVTRNIQRQRFFNAVNRAGRRMSEYLVEIFGKGQAPDYHNPFFLAHTTDHVGNNEVENTGAAQVAADATNTVTSTMMAASERYAFEVDVDRPCILIGITSFDITRFYPRATERQNFHVDRFDMFNPFMQTIGDQVVYRDELDASASHDDYFGYQLRHMEYKQRFSQAFGGVVNPSTDLDYWFFLADESLPESLKYNIGPDYIRSRPFELDRFYASLTGRSLGTYFHFIVKVENECVATRPMIYAPTIL